MTEVYDWDEAALTPERELTAERKRLGLSQLDVAELMGVTQSLVSQIENGDPDVNEVTILLRRTRTSTVRSEPMAA